MNNRIRVLMSTEVPNLNEDVDLQSLLIELDTYITTLGSGLNLEDLLDWRLLVNLLAQRTDAIAIAKRVARYPSDKECVIYISIPIPDGSQTTYGLTNVKEAFFKKSNEKYSHTLKPYFENYDNLYEYLLESSKQAINLSFTNGFTCNGKKIKLQDKDNRLPK